MSTTALALAAAWPGPEPVIVVEADPHGGTLADACGGDPRRGLASLTAAAGEGAVLGLAELREHLQWHPVGVAYLAAPPRPADTVAALAHPIPLSPKLGSGCWGELVVVADSGLAAPDSAAAPLLRGADLALVVVRTPAADTTELLAKLRELAAWCPRLQVVIVGSPGPREVASDLDVPVLGWLPHQETTATAIVRGRPRAYHSDLGVATRALAMRIHEGVGVDAVTAPSRSHPRIPWRRGVQHRSQRSVPLVYRLGHHLLDTTIDRPATQPPYVAAATRIEDQPLHAAAPITAAEHAPLATRTSDPGDRALVLAVRVFGPLRVLWLPGTAEPEQPPVEITARLQHRSREVLALLAVHPQGLTRAQLIEALWGRRSPNRPTNTLHTTLSRLRTAIAEATGGTVDHILARDSARYRLDASVSTDYADFAVAVAQRRRAGTDTERRDTCRRIVELTAAGTFAADLDADWIDPIRQAVRRDAATALGALAQSLVAEDPRATLHLLETVLDVDPANEQVYCDVMRLHARLGEFHAIDHTAELLVRRLAEIGEKPSRETIALVRHLHRNAS
ncbi:winged helix-turn-helix domain-containing protein [Nocardia sp. NPDC046473]|uniref:winged helix-turn-helix domain-containing protein n=1 Tax=Nocardia sp. NPDC046473 TaxID=3155733 RepID=UPI0033C74C03